MGVKPLKIGIVTRLSILVGMFAIAIAVVIYVGSDFRTASLYRKQRETRMRFLAKTMSFGVKNMLVSAGSKREVENVVRGSLQKAMSADPSVIGCEVHNAAGETVFSFSSPGVNMDEYPSVSVDVTSEGTLLGDIQLHYYHQNVLENEKTLQVVAIGNTMASMVGYYLKKSDYFQVKFLSQNIIEEDPDVLYSSISGPGGAVIYAYRLDEFSEYLTDEVNERAESVSAVRPVMVQDLGWSKEHGRMVEVAVVAADGDRRLGVVRIGYSLASLMEALARSRLALTMAIAGAAFLALGLSITLARGITRPLGELTNAARSVSPHQLGTEAQLDNAEHEIQALSHAFEHLGDRLSARGDEVGDLATSFQDMIRNLQAYLDQLKLFYQKMSLADRLYAMGQLSAGIAHEINNPLTVISTCTQIMLKTKELDEDVREDLEMILKEINRITEKVRDLQSFSQESKYEFQSRDLHELLDKTLGLCRHQVKSAGAFIDKKYCEDCDPVSVVDPGKIRQVFLNLILNAVQAMEESAEKVLTVSTSVDEVSGEVKIEFRDTGPGIAPENIGRIFDPFFTTKKPGSGTGLGLAICYGIMQSHGGGITVDSAPGQGTAFKLTLPLDK